MNSFEREELEAENDGFSNDYQRAAFVSRMRGKQDDLSKARELVAAGHTVLVAFRPWHCSITDAVIGEYVHIVASAPPGQSLAYEIDPADIDPEERHEVWPVLPKTLGELVATFEKDEVPF